MKTNTIIFAVLAVTTAALCAYVAPDGEWNTWHGELAGDGVAGARNVFVGAGAAADASTSDRNTFVGAAAGAFSTNCMDCVFVGYRAGRTFSDMSNVVVVGATTMPTQSLANATIVNGQIFVRESEIGDVFGYDGGVYIVKPSPSATNAPLLEYEHGILKINAFEVDFSNTRATGVSINHADKALRLYDDESLNHGFLDVSYTYSDIVANVRNEVLEYIRTNGVENAWVTNRTTATLRN